MARGVTALGVDWARRPRVLACPMRQPLRTIVRAACAGGAALLAACGPKAAPPPTPAAAGPALILYYADAAGVHRLDARTGADSLSFRVSGSRVISAVSPDHTKLALGLAAPHGARLVIVDAASGQVSAVHSAGQGYGYTLAWSPNGARLAFGYSAGKGRGDILVTTPDGKPIYEWLELRPFLTDAPAVAE